MHNGVLLKMDLKRPCVGAGLEGTMRRILAFHRPGWAACLVCAIVAMAFGTVSQARAQYASAGDWNRTTDTMAGALGVHYGKLGGHGLSFRYPLHWYLYLQTSGGIWHTADHKRHNVGAQLDYILRQEVLLFGPDKMDMTNQVIREYDKRHAAKSEKKKGK